MKVFYSNVHRQHDPPFEIIDGGQRAPYLEDPGRIDGIVAALRETAWAQFSEPAEFPLSSILAVHSAEYLDFLARAWEQWLATLPAGQPVPADSMFLPATFALRRQPHRPTSILGRAGYHMMDLSAVIVEGTYRATLAAANCALSAASTVSTSGGEQQSALALTRPPGHHAGRDYAAGYCFVNNAAVAAQALAAEGKVAILDIDYHAGNGTQDMFYARSDVLTISLHADPAFEYPYYAGYADETGAGEGLDFHRNFPLPGGTGDAEYLAALEQAVGLIERFAPRHLVVSAGMDIYAGDVLGRFAITRGGIHTVGEHIAGLGLPTAVILEGGYNNAALGENMVAFIEPFAE